MKKNVFKPITLIPLLFLSGCLSDDNAKAIYGDKTGLPANCRAYIQYAIDSYRAGKYTADATFNGLERNCGANGISWKENR